MCLRACVSNLPLECICVALQIVDLHKGFAGGAVGEKQVELLSNNVMSLIAYFNLDPNRVLDVMLDCLEAGW